MIEIRRILCRRPVDIARGPSTTPWPSPASTRPRSSSPTSASRSCRPGRPGLLPPWASSTPPFVAGCAPPWSRSPRPRALSASVGSRSTRGSGRRGDLERARSGRRRVVMGTHGVAASSVEGQRAGAQALVKIRAYARAVWIRLMGLGPIPAVRKILHREKLTINDFGAIELNEAFASQAIACIGAQVRHGKNQCPGKRHLHRHPIGCSGARLLLTLANEMVRKGHALDWHPLHRRRSGYGYGAGKSLGGQNHGL